MALKLQSSRMLKIPQTECDGNCGNPLPLVTPDESLGVTGRHMADYSAVERHTAAGRLKPCAAWIANGEGQQPSSCRSHSCPTATHSSPPDRSPIHRLEDFDLTFGNSSSGSCEFLEFILWSNGGERRGLSGWALA